MIKAWVNDLNTTAFRIVVSVWIAAFVVVGLTTAMLFFGWQPTTLQLKVLNGVAASVLTMMGFDVLQFVGKRFSDAGYVAARNAIPASSEAPTPSSAEMQPPHARTNVEESD